MYRPTELLGRVVVWLAVGYREAPLLERLLILPSWMIARGLFLVGYRTALTLHAVAHRSHGHR